MLRKRTRSHLKDHQMTQLTGDSVSESKFYSFLSSPMFVGFTSKALECDSAISPTSPLDFRILSSLGNPFRSPRSSNVGHRKTWFRNKVGLGIIDSPDFEAEHSGKVLRASDSKNIIFGIKTFNSQSSTEAPKSLPKGVGIFPYTNTRPSNTKSNSSADEFENGDSTFELESSVKARSLSFGSERSESNLGGLSKDSSFLGYRGSVSEKGTGPTTIDEVPKSCDPPDVKQKPIITSIGSSNHLIDNIPKDSSFLGYRGSVSEKGTGPTTIDEVPKSCDPPDVKQKPIITSIGSSNHLIDNIPPSEIELSEDYTCVRVHGPNPRVTHIFGDCILECQNNDLTNFGKNKEDGNAVPPPGEISKNPSYPLSDFLRVCNSCNKNLDGEDIYMYRGEKAFCSLICRLQEILIDEEMEKTNEDNCEDFAKPSNNEESSELSWFIAT